MSEKFFSEQPDPVMISNEREGFTSWLEINLDNIEFNLCNIRKRVDVEIMAVVKNNAYGHGLTPIVAFLEQIGVRWVMVAKLSEALEIKNRGFSLDVLNMDVLFTDQQYKEVVAKGVTQTIYTLEAAGKLSRAAQSLDKIANIFVKVDTGLNRVGVRYDEAADLITKISKIPMVNIMGVYSTFVQVPDQDTLMLDRFKNVIEDVKLRGVNIPFRSFASSDAVFHNPEAWLNMVRPGVSLYGVYPEKKDKGVSLELKQALSMKSRLEHVKIVEKGESVTYWGRFTAPERMPIGTLHVGFYDGIPREMANRGSILVEGEYRTSIGSVSLNHYLVDLRDVKAQKGDEVTIISETGPNDIYHTAKTAGWMVYSLLNHLNKDTPRIYYRKGIPVALTK